jgi:hypothetical protein
MDVELVTATLASSAIRTIFSSLTGADDRREFEKTPDGRKARRKKLAFLYVGLTLVAGGLTVAILGWLVFIWPPGVAVASALSGAVLAGAVAFAGRAQYTHELSLFTPIPAEAQLLQIVKEREEAAKDTSLPAMLKHNREQMALYHTIATTQARAAGRNSQIAISLGFVVLLSGAVVAILSSDVTTKIVTAALASLGGIFAGYITKTFFVAQDRAIRQLFDYWQQPLATSYILAAERIVEQYKSDDVREQQLGKLMLGILGVAETVTSSGRSEGH